jgi:hypothetical protein
MNVRKMVSPSQSGPSLIHPTPPFVGNPANGRNRPRLWENAIAVGSWLTCIGRAATMVGCEQSDPDGLHQRPNTQNRYYPLHVVGENMEAHLGSDLLQRLGQEVRTSHPRFESSERVFHGLPAHAHGIRHSVKPGLHCIQDAFVLPALDSLKLFRRAAGLEGAGKTSCQVTVLIHVVSAIRTDGRSGQVLTGWTGIVVLCGVVEEVPQCEEPALGTAGGQSFGDAGQHAGVLARQHLIAVEVAAVSQ